MLETHHEAAFGWAVTCCGGDEDEAADVLQDAYMRLLDGRARFERRARFRTFVFGVIRRVAADRSRRRARRLGLLRAVPPEPALAAGASSVEGPSEEALRLRAALAELSPRQRELLHLVFYEGLTIERAAETIGTSLGTARTHYERGKARLRRLLADDDAEPGRASS